jgi:heme/copper-type cytochrome/quinol oxidase subunit 3
VHFGLKIRELYYIVEGFIITIILAILFICLQLSEYFNSVFNISDSIYGTVFFMLTGLHGFHVFVGSVFIIVCFFRFINLHFTNKHFIGFEVAA